jgi:hypothetical protein
MWLSIIFVTIPDREFALLECSGPWTLVTAAPVLWTNEPTQHIAKWNGHRDVPKADQRIRNP